MLPVAPALFSTTKVCLNCVPRWLLTARAMVSVAPPAGNGTTTFTDLSGQANAGALAASVARPRQMAVVAFLMVLMFCLRYVPGRDISTPPRGLKNHR
ncbi:hypothetical protein D3C85_1386850 [compost metagenome]